MAEELLVAESGDRETLYAQLLPQLKALTSGEPNLTANLANVAAAIRQTFGFFWIGFYLVDGDELPGHIACSSASRSEVVVPIVKNGAVLGVLDIDSDRLDDFSSIDVRGLEAICDWLGDLLPE